MFRGKGLVQLSVRVVNWLSSVSYIVACAALVVMTFSVAYEVCMRYVFKRPTIWSFEICSYLFIAMVLLAAAHVHRVDRHIKMEYLSNVLSVRATAWNRLFASILGVFYCALVVWKGGEFAMTGYHYHSASILAAPLFPTMVMVPIGFLLWGLQYLVKIGEAIQTLRGSKGEPEGSLSDQSSNASKEEKSVIE